jgi:hypothetical protein
VVGGGGVHGRKVLLYIKFRATCAKLLSRAVLVILSKNAVSSYVQLPTATSLRAIKSFQVTVRQGCPNPGRRITVATIFCTVEPTVGRPSVWNLMYITLLASGTLL